VSRARLVRLLLGVIAPLSLHAQAAPMAGDGRVHVPNQLEVGYSPLKPNEVTTIIVQPLLGTVLRFPYKVQSAPVADDATFQVTPYENTVLIATKNCVQGCAAMLHVFLNDGELTPVPFLLVVDTLRPPTIKRDFTDQVSAQIRAHDIATAEALEARATQLVAERLEAEVERCVATGFSFRPVNVQNAWRDDATGESVGVTVSDVGFSGRCLAHPKLYIRYRLDNARYSPIKAVRFVVARHLAKRRNDAALSVLEDRRDPTIVPPLREVRGELVVDGGFDLAVGESLVLTVVVDGHPVEMGVLLTAPGGRP
jgi:hypothetical protein